MAGLLLIVLLSTALGASLYDRDRKKVQTLSALCSFIDEIYTGIRYTGSTVEEILDCCANNPIYSPLSFLKRIISESQKSCFSQSVVRKAIVDSSEEMNLKKDDLIPLLNMAEKLGTTDAVGQLQMLENCKNQLLELKSAQIKRCDTLGKMYISLGLLFGIGTAVILA